MSFENINHPSPEKKILLEDISLQAKLAEYVYKQEHPETISPSHKEIMMSWITTHAEHWRHVIDTHTGEQVDLKDPQWIARCYELLKEDESGPTVH